MPSADDYGIDFTGSTDVTAALAAAINAQSPGTTFTLHPNGKYLTTGIQTNIWTAPGITVDGLNATLFRNVPRTGDAAVPPGDILNFNAPGSTLKNLNVYGFRKDTYTGDKLTAVAGSPGVSGTTVLLDAANEEVRLPKVGLDYFVAAGNFTNFETPYYFRYGLDGLVHFEASLSATSGAGAALLTIYDDDDDSVLAQQSVDPTGSAATYSVTFDPAPDHLGTRMRVTVKKVTGTGTITVHSMTPWGEAGYRRRGLPAPLTFTSGNEFADGIGAGSAANVTYDNVWVEGPDGDGFNLTNAGPNCTVINCTARCNGRMGYTVEYSSGLEITDCLSRESGRAGVDFEPQSGGGDNDNTVITNFTGLNARNYGMSMTPWGLNTLITLTDITTTNCGMGAIFGGGTGLTIQGWTHSGTYRTEADRIANGGGIALPDPLATPVDGQVDFLCWGEGVVGDDITTELGVYIKNKPSRKFGFGTTQFFPDNVHLTNVRVTDPAYDPPYVTELANSSVEIVSGSTDIGWDSSSVVWDDPGVTWDQSETGGGGLAEPAFQNTAFQADAFQLQPAVTNVIAQTMPMFSQDAVAFDGYAAPTEQLIPAFEQVVAAINGRAITITQFMPSFHTVGNSFAFQDDAFQLDAFETGQTSNSQDVDVSVTIRARIGFKSGDFQADAFQDDAFELAESSPVEIPSFTQHALVANVPHGQNFAPVTQRMPAFTQEATGAVQSGIVVEQAIPFPHQALTAFETPAGAIAQTMPAFTQTVVAGIIIAPVGSILQTIPMFQQTLRVGMVRWDEWPVTPGSEWPVSVDDEWLVRR